MSMEMVPASKGDRPAVIEHEGWRVHVHVMDAFHLRRRSELKRAIMDAHPDRGGSTWRFLVARREYASFMRKEFLRYAQYGLRVPKRT